jgi:hypothetical protein
MGDAESFVHRKFSDKCVGGEWFELEEADLEWFEEFKDHGMIYQRDDLRPCPAGPLARPEWSEPFVDEITEQIAGPT